MNDMGIYYSTYMHWHINSIYTTLKLFKYFICCSVAQSCLILFNLMGCSTPEFPVLHYLLELAQIMFTEFAMLSDHLIRCHCLLLLSSIFPSIRVLSTESGLHINYWDFSINPSSEYSGLTSFRIDWFDLLAVQGTHKSLFQHNSKASILWCSAFFNGPTLTSIHDYWKNHDLDYKDLCLQSVSAF